MDNLEARTAFFYRKHAIKPVDPDSNSLASTTVNARAANDTLLDSSIQQAQQYINYLNQANLDIDHILKRGIKNKHTNTDHLEQAYARQRLAVHQLHSLFERLFVQYPEMATYLRQQMVFKPSPSNSQS